MRHQQTGSKNWLWSTVAAVGLALPASAALHEVQQQGISFVPTTVTAAPGDTIRWIWTSGTHTVTSGSGCTYDGLYFDEPLTAANPIVEFVVPDGVSEIPYFCIPHCAFGMTGTIVVESIVAEFQITLDGDQLDPPVDTAATGTGTATLSSANTFSWEITFSGLEGSQTGAHFHGPAPACESAGVQIGLPLGSPIVGSQTITPQQAADLLAGLWYVNIHTDLHPAGEIRGQVMPVPLDDPLPGGIPTGMAIDLQPIATGLTAPNWGTFAPGDESRLFVTDQDGILWAIDLTTGNKSVFLDVSALLVPLGVFGPDSFDERGLLGVAFHPDYSTNGLLYTYTSEPVGVAADYSTMPIGETANHQAVITEWQVPAPGDPGSVVDPGSARVLLRIDEPQFNHNAGCLNFDPSGLLYIALGDGGGADDHDGQDFIGAEIIGHGCLGNGADNENPLGAILRIDPLGSDSPNGQYGLPPGNPFVGGPGLDEIYAYGFRNPFRFSYDPVGNVLYVADVGQNDVEEIDIVAGPGGNYGWRYKEGSFYFVFNGNEPGYVTDVPLDAPAGLIDPVAEYDHDEGTAVVGGFVYRGTALPQLYGRYVFGDFARTFSNDGRLFYLDENGDIVEFDLGGPFGHSLLGFGQDARGELYVLANDTGTPFGDTGLVLRIALLGDMNCDGVVNAFDIDAFILALTDPAGYAAAYPDCDFRNADINGDGQVNAFDIDPFIDLLTGG